MKIPEPQWSRFHGKWYTLCPRCTKRIGARTPRLAIKAARTCATLDELREEAPCA